MDDKVKNALNALARGTVHTIRDGCIHIVNGEVQRGSGVFYIDTRVHPATFGMANGIQRITTSLEDFVTTLKRISLMGFYADYTRMKENENFKRLYGYAFRDVIYYDGARNLETYPCNKCGLILPLNQVTIDHQKPQAGGEILAVLKTLRAFGLTVEGPKGAKGKNVAQNAGQFNKLHSTMMSHQFPIAIPHADRHPDTGSKASRQTLNLNGMLFYSILVWAKVENEFSNNCMHSFLNLKPMCGSCNSTKGNKVADADADVLEDNDEIMD